MYGGLSKHRMIIFCGVRLPSCAAI